MDRNASGGRFLVVDEQVVQVLLRAQVGEALVGPGAFQSPQFCTPAARFQVGEIRDDVSRYGFQLLTFQPRIEAGPEAGANDHFQHAPKLAGHPLSPHKQHAADQPAIALQAPGQMAFGQYRALSGLPAVGTVAALAAQRAAREQKGQRYLVGHFLPDDLFHRKTKLLHDSPRVDTTSSGE